MGGVRIGHAQKGAGPKDGACQNQAGKGWGYDGHAHMGAGLRGARGNGHKEAGLQHQAERGGVNDDTPTKGRGYEGTRQQRGGATRGHANIGEGLRGDTPTEGRGYEGTRPLRGGATAQCRWAGSEKAAPRKGRGQRTARARIRLDRGGVTMDTPPWGRGYAGREGMATKRRGCSTRLKGGGV